MIIFILTMVFLSGFSFFLGLFPLGWESRPTLEALGYASSDGDSKKKKQSIFRKIALINKPFCTGKLRKRIAKDLSVAHIPISPEEFFFIKEACIIFVLAVSYPMIKPDMIIFWFLMSFCFGYMLPEYWMKGKIRSVKGIMVKELPDSIDLLGLCVNAGLDFMLALKWVIEKSPPSVMIAELNILLQEINVGKTRRDALRDLSSKYDLPDLATFSRTLIQADKMGTSVSEALNILSEDMRIARYRRGEKMAMKAPLKLLVPLLFFIFPTVGILVAGPIFLQFLETNPMDQMVGNAEE